MTVKAKTRQLAENLLKNLLSEAETDAIPTAQEPGPDAVVAEEEPEFYEMVELLFDQRGWHHPGASELEELAEILGYRQGLDEFFDDNPGAISAIIEWIQQLNHPDDKWIQGVQAALSDRDEDESSLPPSYQ